MAAPAGASVGRLAGASRLQEALRVAPSLRLASSARALVAFGSKKRNKASGFNWPARGLGGSRGWGIF